MTIAKAAISGQVAAAVVYAGTPEPRTSQLAAMLTLGLAARFAAVDAIAALVPYAETAAAVSMTSAIAALVPYATGIHSLPAASAIAELAVWGTAPPGSEARTRAWAFVFDGHPCYVLDLGEEGTFIYDTSTSGWAKFSTDGYVGWNMRIGTTWTEGNRIIGGDTFSANAWEMDPDTLIDEGFRDIYHAATGGVATRSRVYLGVESLRVIGSMGSLDDDTPVQFSLRFSDDNGKTWTATQDITLTVGDFGGEVAWRSLGSFMAPGRVFELTDYGGLQRIDGADIFIEDFDDISTKYLKQYGVYE
jgi:hypothetical protein